MDRAGARVATRASGIALGFLAALACAAVGIGLVVSVAEFRPFRAFGIIAALAIPVIAWMSGNARIFCLWGLMLTVPLEISKYFVLHRHYGGEVAFRLEASDVFLIPLLFFWLRDHLRRNEHGIRVPFVAKMWVLMMLMGVWVMIVGPWRTFAAYEVFRMGKVLLLFLMICNEIRRPKGIHQIVVPLLVCTLLLSVFGLLQYVSGAAFKLEFLGEPEKKIVHQLGFEGSRIGSLMVHPNVFGGFLAMMLPVAMALLFCRVSGWYKLLCVITLLVGQAALVLTLSRAGWISFGLAALLVLGLGALQQGSGRRYVIPRLVTLAVILALCLAFSRNILDRLYLSDPLAVTTRFELMNIAWKMVLEKPVFGFGLNSWTFEMVAFSTDPALAVFRGDLVPPVHNIYLAIWAEQGTVGLVLFLLIIGGVIRAGLRNMRIKDEALVAINIGMLAGFVAICVDGLADWIIRINPVMRVFWVFAGVILAMDLWQRASKRPPRIALEPAAGQGISAESGVRP